MRLKTISAATALAVASVFVIAPAALAKDAPYKAPRNATGQPDLQGVWTNATITPLERPPALGDRLVLTEPEARRAESGNAARVQGAAQPTKEGTKVDELPSCGGGQTGPACGYNAFWVDPGTKVIRIGTEARSSIIVSPKNGHLPLNTAAQTRIRNAQGNARVGNFDGPERRPLGERCLVGFGSTSGPPMLPVLYNNHYTIVQTAEEVMIQVEMVHDTRIIRLNDAHRPANMRQWMGDSIGHWDGDTLVVETTNFRPDQTFRGATAGQKVTERFTRISPQQILYQFEVDDPAALSEPVKGEESFNATNDRVYEYACHEGNYALPGILAGARTEEKKGREMDGARGEVKEEGAQ
jgi:hypothetical protein